MPDLLLLAMNAKQNGDITQAKQLLAQALIQNPRNEGAWMLMYEVVDDAKLKRNCLERVLAINPANTTASLALMKLDTSPLGPVVRGERFKPIMPAQPEKTAPFTPPFTWNGDESQFKALENENPEDLENKSLATDTPTSFDWAAESGEPDKTINKIFDAVSNPEKASQPLQDADLSWLDRETLEEKSETENKPLEANLLEAPEGILPGKKPEPLPVNLGDFSVSAEPEWGVDAFAYTESSNAGPVESEPLLWDNPKAPVDRLVILGNKSIIYANPVASDIPHILGLFNEKKMLRDLLGENAGVIKLDTIQRLYAIPRRSNLEIEYLQNEKTTTHQLIFKDRAERDEALSAIQMRLGADFTRRTQSIAFLDKILSPVLWLLVVAALGWLFIAGLPRLADVPAFQSGMLQLILYNLQYYANLIGAFNIFVIALVLGLLCLIWLVINLSKPSKEVFVDRKSRG